MPHRGKKLALTQMWHISSVVCKYYSLKKLVALTTVCSRSILTSSQPGTAFLRQSQHQAQATLFQYGWLLCRLWQASWLAVWWPGSSSLALAREKRGRRLLQGSWRVLRFKVPAHVVICTALFEGVKIKILYLNCPLRTVKVLLC